MAIVVHKIIVEPKIKLLHVLDQGPVTCIWTANRETGLSGWKISSNIAFTLVEVLPTLSILGYILAAPLLLPIHQAACGLNLHSF